MTQDELTLELTIKMPDDDMFFVARDLIESYYGSAITDGGSYIFHGVRQSPFCFVAHIDTMRTSDNLDLEFDGKILRNRNGILGADDRAGVFIFFRILRECTYLGIPYPSILLTNFEELGLIGAKEFTESGVFEEFDCNEYVKLFVGLDRFGHLEYSSYDLPNPPEVAKYIEERIGFKHTESVLRSDVCVLNEAFSIPAVNLSVGYHFQHKPMEFLDVQSLTETFRKVLTMIRNPYYNGNGYELFLQCGNNGIR